MYAETVVFDPVAIRAVLAAVTMGIVIGLYMRVRHD